MSEGHSRLDTSDVEAHQLYGKTNYLEWRRHFDRAAKAHDLWDIMTGVEKVLGEPKEESYVTYFPQQNEPPKTRAASAKDDKEESKNKPSAPIIDTQRSLFLWQAAYRRWERQKDKVKMARMLISKSVVSSIAYEVEDIREPNLQAVYIKEHYGVSDEYARGVILEQMASLKLYQCDSMSDYINQHRDLKTDLLRLKQPYSNSQMATNIINGLPKSFGEFIRLWEFHRSQHIGSEPDINFLIDRLLQEDMTQSTNKKKTKNNSGHDQNKAAKSEKVCAHCNKSNHDEKDCWSKYPEKMPQRFKNQQAAASNTPKAAENKGKGEKPAGIVAMISGTDQFLAMMSPDSTSRAIFSNSNNADNLSQCEPNLSQCCEEGIREKDEGCGGKEEGHALLVKDSSVDSTTRGASLTGRNTILLDSGANICIFNDKNWFSELKSFDITVSAVEGSQNVNIQGGGSVQLTLLSSDGSKTPLTILQAAYAPNAKYNIISVTYLATRAGLKGCWDSSRFTIEHEGREVGVAQVVEGLYHLRIETDVPPESTAFAGNINYDNPVWTWHRRLGHLSLQNMINLLDISEGIPLTKQQIRAELGKICPVCATSRSLVRIPRDPATRRAQEVGALIHADVWGPYSIEALDGSRYWLFFIDDAMRYTWGLPFARKHDLLAIFRHLHYLIENGHGATIRGYRFDGEFSRGPVGTWLNKKHIPYEATVPYDHYMGGTHERVNRTLREKAAPMIQELTISGQISKIITEKALETIRESKVPEAAYSEAIRYSIWLKNRSPTRALKNKKTPWEALYNRKPIFQRETIWGSRMYITLPPETHRMGKPKLHQPRGWVGYFVGCQAESIYRVFSDEHHRVFPVGAARVQQGEGVEDNHEGITYQQRQLREAEEIQDEVVQYSLPENDAGCLPLSSSESDDIDDLANDIWFDDADDSDCSLSSQNENEEHDDLAEFFEEDEERHVVPNDATETGNNISHPSAQATTNDLCTHLSDDGQNDIEYEVTSRFFANVVERNTECDYPPPSSSESDTDQDSKIKPLVASKRIQPPVMEKPCRSCWIRGLKCLWSAKGDTAKCDFCARARCRCYIPDYDDPDEIEAKRKFDASQQIGGKRRIQAKKAKRDAIRLKKSREQGRAILPRVYKRGVPAAQKCTRCLERTRACNGESPCDTCIQGNHVCIPQNRADTPKCNNCKNKGRCDRGTPCGRCVATGKDCTYYAESGLVTILYPVKEASIAKTNSSSEDCCSACQRDSKKCDGEQPCFECVKATARGTRLVCIYRKDNHLEKYNTSAYTLDERNRVSLRPDWEDHTSMAMNKKRGQKATASRIHNEMKDQGIHTITKSPRRNYEIIPTEIGNLECGFFSLVHSITAQLPDIAPPTLEDLRQIFQGPEMTQRNADTLMDNENNLSIDQMAGILQLWGSSRSLNLQLGTFVEGQEPLIVQGSPNADTIWVHNDNASENGTNPGLVNHFSGVTFNNNPSRETSPQPEVIPNLEETDLDADIAFFKWLSNKGHINVVERDFATEPEPYYYAEAMRSDEAPEWKAAMEDEKQSHDENGTFELIDTADIPEGHIPLQSKWAFKRKINQEGQVIKHKARLVAKGYGQREGIDYTETFSSVIKGTSYRILFAIAALLGWKVWLMDVVTAFLNGHLQELIFMKPPPGWTIPKNKV